MRRNEKGSGRRMIQKRKKKSSDRFVLFIPPPPFPPLKNLGFFSNRVIFHLPALYLKRTRSQNGGSLKSLEDHVVRDQSISGQYLKALSGWSQKLLIGLNLRPQSDPY